MNEKAIHFVQIVKERFKKDLNVEQVKHFYEAICLTLADLGLTSTEDLTEDHLNSILHKYQLEIQPKRPRVRRKTSGPVKGNGDRLKIAFWFISKVGGPDEAKKVLHAAVIAHEALA